MRTHAVVAISVLLLAGCLLYSPPARTQDSSQIDSNNLYFKHIPAEVSFDFLQDPEGFFWLATAAGVYRYDGYHFKKYPELPSAVAIYQDQTRQIWVMSGDGLATYDKLSETFRNVQGRLGKDHFMTFTTLKYQGRGTFEHAGAHLSMVVYRQQTQSCELIRTQGTFLNFIEDISGSTVNSSFTLAIGDVLVLYSDGLTEAKNPNGELLDIHRFQGIVESYAEKETAALRDGVMREVLHWCDNKLEDDMSLVVVRRIK